VTATRLEPEAPARSAAEETPAERLNRNLDQLLDGLRVVLPGVQIFLGFLLTLPFQARFHGLEGWRQALYALALLSTAASTICLMAPSVHHRLRFREGQKASIVRWGNRLAIAGFGLLSLGITATLALVCDALFGSGAALAVGLGALVAYLAVWYLPALVLEREQRREA
jgi:cyanate permease